MEATRDAGKIVIKNFLWNDQTGLPLAVYSEEVVEEKSEEVFWHVLGPIPICRRRCMPHEQLPLAFSLNWPYSGTVFT